LVKRFMTDIAGRSPSPSRHDPRSLAARPGAAPFRLLTIKAVRPGANEIAANPRARSARLRAIERVSPATSSSETVT
jgi:16S rRNA (cytosine1402-N4)-methyltransferase